MLLTSYLRKRTQTIDFSRKAGYPNFLWITL